MWLKVTGAIYVALFAFVIPLAAIASARALARSDPPPRAPLYRGIILQQLAFLLLSVGVAYAAGIPLLEIPRDVARSALVALGVLALLLVTLRPLWRRAIQGRARFTALTMPATAVERRLWIGVSIAAGVSEEIAYRGVLVAILSRATGNPLLAAMASAVAFGGAHAVQGAIGAIVSTVIALLFQWLTGWSGSLMPAVMVHVCYDVVAGFAYARLGREAGVIPRGAA